ncbi:Yip1 domain-containing protein [Rhodovulum sp. ES.010]|nr:Yip1 domain-containing protein [Rhodovulum sp. ES.010]
MPNPRPSLVSLARDTVTDPRDGATRVLALHLDEGTLWQALVAVVAVSVLLTQLGNYIVATPIDPLLPIFEANPLLAAVIQGGLLVVMVYAIHIIGRRFGGTGAFAGALALTVWLQVIMAMLQAVQILFLLVLPPVSGLIGLFGIGLFFWLLSHFVAVLHSFDSALKTFAGIVMSMIAIVFGMSLLMSILGITLGGALTDV